MLQANHAVTPHNHAHNNHNMIHSNNDDTEGTVPAQATTPIPPSHWTGLPPTTPAMNPPLETTAFPPTHTDCECEENDYEDEDEDEGSDTDMNIAELNRIHDNRHMQSRIASTLAPSHLPPCQVCRRNLHSTLHNPTSYQT